MREFINIVGKSCFELPQVVPCFEDLLGVQGGELRHVIFEEGLHQDARKTSGVSLCGVCDEEFWARFVGIEGVDRERKDPLVEVGTIGDAALGQIVRRERSQRFDEGL